MPTVSVNDIKTPVTTKSNGIAVAAVPNLCKMPPPPPPFAPLPLPNIGRSGLSPKGYTKTVTVEGAKVAIRGATFGSFGDIASKPTGGGVISSNTHGPTAFVSPGSMDVSFEGKAVQLLGDAMTNNNGSPPNSSTPMEGQAPSPSNPCDLNVDCAEKQDPAKTTPAWDACQVAQVCEMVKAFNNVPKDKIKDVSPSPRGTKPYQDQLKAFKSTFAAMAAESSPDDQSIKDMFYNPPPPNDGCAHKQWKAGGADANPSGRGPGKFNPDHSHPAQFGASLQGIAGLKWADARVNTTVGPAMNAFKVGEHTHMTASKCCD